MPRQRTESEHSPEFWRVVDETLAQGRSLAGTPPQTPLRTYCQINDRAMDVMVDRNLLGIEREKQKNVTFASVLYEANVSDIFDGTHPYDRLRVIYAKRKWYTDAIDVCRAYIAIPDRPVGQDKSHFQHHLERLLQKSARESSGDDKS